ncbi:MAG: hypothetical protein WB647_05145 [Roseiarcus sp.]|uniref:hypothetical protein n=1 Tax=Roseiarcus sp. TaxID=1969460 RepID=UPI003C49C186
MPAWFYAAAAAPEHPGIDGDNRAARVDFFLLHNARNPLKSPDSEEWILEKERKKKGNSSCKCKEKKGTERKSKLALQKLGSPQTGA